MWGIIATFFLIIWSNAANHIVYLSCRNTVECLSLALKLNLAQSQKMYGRHQINMC